MRQEPRRDEDSARASACRMAGWTIALAIGMSFTNPSDLTIDLPSSGTHDTFHNVRWDGKPFVSPFYYVVRFGCGDAQVDFTHYKIYADESRTVRETGTWHGEPVDGDVRLDRKVQHLEISHGVNALALVGIFHDPFKRGLYIGGGPLIYLSHAESTVDGKPYQWGYGHSGNGFEAFVGDGIPAPWAELKYDMGKVRVGVADGTASVPLSTLHISVSP
jgi:hypothetical protein